MGETGRVVALLGAGGALGAVISQHFAAEPETHLVLSDVDESALAHTLATLEDQDAVEHLRADVRKLGEVEAVVARAVERFGRLDVLISNAGVLTGNARIHRTTDADWERSFGVNLMGAVNALRAAVPAMRQQGGGAVILTASVAGMTAWSHSSPYGAMKAAVIHLTKIAAVEYAPDGIRVNCVCPGAFESTIHADLPERAMEVMAERHPLGLGSATDVVGAYLYLASEAARWTTGSTLVVDGGYAAP